MKKISCMAIAILAIFLLMSCGKRQPESSTDIKGNRTFVGRSNPNIAVPKQDSLNIEKFASSFLKEYPDLNNNSITRKEAAKAFQQRFKQEVNRDSLLKGIPVELRHLKDAGNGKYTAHFWSAFGANNHSFELKHPFKKINFDLSVSLPREVAIDIKEKSQYLISVHYVGHINNISTFQQITGDSDWVLNPDVELTPLDRSQGEGLYDINLGLMNVDLLSIEPYKK